MRPGTLCDGIRRKRTQARCDGVEPLWALRRRRPPFAILDAQPLTGATGSCSTGAGAGYSSPSCGPAPSTNLGLGWLCAVASTIRRQALALQSASVSCARSVAQRCRSESWRSAGPAETPSLPLALAHDSVGTQRPKVHGTVIPGTWLPPVVI
eukprot:scaffold11243_cov131-Isochrysis_galbana.AAC.2